jgi:uracil-DNA glycosylase
MSALNDPNFCYFQKTLQQNIKDGWEYVPDLILYNLFEQYKTNDVFPSMSQVTRCFTYFNLVDTKVVLLGQDPYINSFKINGTRVSEACGLSFSVPKGIRLPPSLRNMFNELKADVGVEKVDGDLESWAGQGVLMLNSALTVIEGESNSHASLWNDWTDKVIKKVSDQCEGVVFILLGNYARAKKVYIDGKRHCVIEAGHPSPLNRKQDFNGSKIYSRANEYLKSKGKEEISW